VLRRSVTRAQARDKVRRNVVLLCEVPQGTDGRPSKSLTLDQAEALLSAAAGTPLHAYVVVSLLTGARTEELRPLTWSHVDLDGETPCMMVWRSVRAGGDTKTRKSRRTLALPARCVAALREQVALVVTLKADAGRSWRENDLVFPSRSGTLADAANVRRSFRKVTAAAGLDSTDWTPRELRHSFVSLMSDAGVPIEQISRLVGHSGTTVTEAVYRKQIRPVITEGAEVMDRLFPGISPQGERPPRMPSYSVGYSMAKGHVAVTGNVASGLYRSVGVTGFEPATSSSRTKRATKLRHTPLQGLLNEPPLV
jgi:integrase